MLEFKEPEIFELGTIAELTAGTKSNGVESVTVTTGPSWAQVSKTNTINAHE